MRLRYYSQLKAYYRSNMVRKVIRIIEASEVKLIANGLARKLTLIDAVHLLKKSWSCVITVTIINCFKKSGFGVPDLNLQEEQSGDDRTTLIPPEMTDAEFQHFVDMDLDLQATGMPTQEDICNSILVERAEARGDIEPGDSDDEEIHPAVPNFIRPPECTVNNSSRFGVQ
ncbi:unnamed protein product [Mytilus coruscus]|uniref:DDE-1 domain-containing protein n=1 Tax=Mytilus coruscus TaxID=42192 RepID=A0A6J8EYI1_MYTCO|nr:unnamed protein product [Mytilus coruscus]